MSDEYTEETPIPETPVEQVEQSAEPTETPTETPAEETPEQVEAKRQEAVNQAIGKQHKKYRDEERDHLITKQRVADLEAQAQQFAPQKPNIPDMPDSFDDNYDSLMTARDQAIRDSAKFDATQAVQLQQQQQSQYQEQQKFAQELQTKKDTYVASAQKNGISAENMQNSANAIAGYLSQDMQMAILGDPDGALISEHLAANPMVLDELSRMPAYQAGIYIEQNIRAKALELKPRTTQAPAPAQQLKGNGVDKDLGQYKNINGATFE